VLDLSACGADFAFIDASHAYEYVLNDSRKVLAGLPGGHGTILWHDYGVGWRGVTRALHELRRDEPAFRGLRTVAGTTLAILER